MTHDYLKYYKSSFLVFLIGVLLFVVMAAKDYWSLSLSIFGIVSTLLVLITTYLWKYKAFLWLFWIDDFSGRYEGILRYQFINESGVLQKGALKHVKLINQNGSRISICSFTIRDNGDKSSLSENKGMFVEKTKDENHYRLIYSYLNDGSLEQGFPPHYGTEVIKFIKNGQNEKMLTGGYYTNRTPQTRGEFINLKRVSNDLTHDF